MIRFLPDYAGDLMGLPTDENHLNFKWNNPSCKVLFSICKQGKAISCHLASDKKGLRKLIPAMHEFAQFLFGTYDWCEMIFAKTNINSIRKLNEKFGFYCIGEVMGHDIYILPKENYFSSSNTQKFIKDVCRTELKNKIKKERDLLWHQQQ